MNETKQTNKQTSFHLAISVEPPVTASVCNHSSHTLSTIVIYLQLVMI